MEREIKRTYFNQSTERVIFEITSRPCSKQTVEARGALIEILQACIDNHNFLHCDGELMEKGSIVHDGQRWMLRGEALVLKKMENA